MARVVMVTAVLAAACAGADTPSESAPVADWEPVSSGTILPGDPVPLPSGAPVLWVSGDVSNANQGDEVAIDLSALEQMPLVKLEVVEPFEERNVAFEGVLMSDLMAIVGADTQATEAHFTALDDYEVDIPLEELTSTDVLLATRADGEHIPVDAGGPTRIIFPPQSEFGESTDAWIWSVESIVVR